MANIQKTFTNWSIDSLRLRIPTQKISWYDSHQIDPFLIVNEHTSEIISKKNHMYQDNNNEINIYFGIGQYEILSETHEYIEILISSKILGKNYFKGITEDNLKEIYDYIISRNVLKFTYETFVNSTLLDTDFKKDTLCNYKDFQLIIEALKHNTKISPAQGTGYKLTNTINNPKLKDNLGISFGNDKRIGQSNKDVFLKFYQKELEFKNRSWKFKAEYFSNIKIEPTLRTEFTIKNLTRFKTYIKEKPFTLKTLTELSNIEIDSIYKKILSYHLNNIYKMEKITIKEVTKSYDLIKLALEIPSRKDYNQSLDMNFLHISQQIELRKYEKSKKSRLKNEILEVYSDLKTQNSEPIITGKKLTEIYKNLLSLD